jgi:serine/threonine protein kinase
MTANAFGTPEYIAPELYMPNPKFTQACDIYSLGITGIELITGSRKRESIKDIWINNDVTQLLWDMTSWTPSARPDAATVVSRIREIVQAYDKSFSTAVKWGIGLLVGGLLLKNS